jgi:hypothetical protein
MDFPVSPTRDLVKEKNSTAFQLQRFKLFYSLFFMKRAFFIKGFGNQQVNGLIF